MARRLVQRKGESRRGGATGSRKGRKASGREEAEQSENVAPQPRARPRPRPITRKVSGSGASNDTAEIDAAAAALMALREPLQVHATAFDRVYAASHGLPVEQAVALRLELESTRHCQNCLTEVGRVLASTSHCRMFAFLEFSLGLTRDGVLDVE